MSPWIEIEKYPYSAAKAFLNSLSLSDVYEDKRNVSDTTEGNTVPEITPAEAEDPSSLAFPPGGWAERFRIGYENWTVVYSLDDGTETRKAWMKIPIDWKRWVAVLFGDYMEMGDELFYQTYLADGSHPDIEECPGTWNLKAGSWSLKIMRAGRCLQRRLKSSWKTLPKPHKKGGMQP